MNNRILWSLLLWLAVPGNFMAADVVPITMFSNPPSVSASGDSYGVVMSPDGRFVVFCSSADNVVTTPAGTQIPPQTPPRLQVYLRDRLLGLTQLVSISTNAVQANEDALALQISPDGRYVLFQSLANNLVRFDTNNSTDVFLRDVVDSKTLLVSGTPEGIPGSGNSHGGVMTPDAAVVAFVSSATNLVVPDSNLIKDVFVWRRQANTTVLASVGATATNLPLPKSYSDVLSITDDGRYVSFASTATNLIPGLRLAPDVFIRDLQEGVTRWASRQAANLVNSVYGVSNAFNFHPVIASEQPTLTFAASAVRSNLAVVAQYNFGTDSATLAGSNAVVPWSPHPEMRCLAVAPNGRFIAYTAQANQDSNTACIKVWDAQAQTTTLVSGNADGTVDTGIWSDHAAITPDGRFVAFISSPRTPAVDAFASGAHVYVRDLLNQTTEPIDVATNDVPAGMLTLAPPRISADGRYVLFTSAADNLVPGDGNASTDVFVRDRWYKTNDLVSLRHSALPNVSLTGPQRTTEESISADGGYVVFTTLGGAIKIDTNCWEDVYLLDRTTGDRKLVSVATNGFAGNAASWGAVITPDARWVAFSSNADDLVPGDTNASTDVFLRDLHTGRTELVSIDVFVSMSGPSYRPQVAPDGSWVLFNSRATSSNNTPINSQDFRTAIRHLTSGVTRQLSNSGSEGPAQAPCSADGRFLLLYASYRASLYDTRLQEFVYQFPFYGYLPLAVSPDGLGLLLESSGSVWNIEWQTGRTNYLGILRPRAARLSGSGFLVFASRERLLPEDLNPGADLYLQDMFSNERILVTAGANGDSSQPSISGDGRFVAFRSTASNLVPTDTNGQPDVFVWDQQTRSIWIVSVTSSGSSANNRSMLPLFSRNGQWLVFSSWASDLTEEDSHQSLDVFAVPMYLLTAVQPPEASLSLEWPSVPGRKYTIEYADSLDGSWQPLNEPLAALGYKMRITPAPGANSQRFYRLKVGGL